MIRVSGGKKQVEQIAVIRKTWFGGRCMYKKNGIKCRCTFDLEFAHVIETVLSKKKKSGRSSYERLKDLIENPECFLLLCPNHHMIVDNRNSIIVWQDDYYSKRFECSEVLEN